ncbi:hypothetical protein B0H17DRAFT_1049623 [Mycena rosella]|uniref:MYND-type domain-containing protein n=1 Tax=Mycena rosella TaxID=1033263 RepID=A0AAD7DUJ3_MYCRO|nr:hypothetical protein B0H17DRAFT_1049623 [Mycena rosella]
MTTGISNKETIHLQGADGTAFEVDPSTLPSESIIIMGNGGPYITTAKEMADEIPERGPLVQPCGRCAKGPPKGGPAFARCGKCGQTGYCSRECQVAHWKEHKGICKQRAASMAVLAEQREAARLKGERFCTPLTLQTWYRNNGAAVEYAAFHVLEVYKGVAASLLTTHIAVFTLTVDKTTPEDARLVRLVDFGPAPFAEFADMVRLPEGSRAMARKARQSGQMALYFMDMKESLHLIEFHQPPSSEPYTSGKKTPHPHWRLNVTVKLNGGLSTSGE